MSAESRTYPIVQELIDSFAGWLKHRRELKELRELDRFNFDRIASDLKNPAFVDLARVFGLAAFSAKSPEELTKALKDAIAIDKPALIEVSVGAFPSWQSFIPRRRVRGQA